MYCRRTRKALKEHADGDLPADAAARVRSHLDGCAKCSRAARRLSLSSSALASLEDATMPRDASERVLAGIKRDSAGSRPAAGFLRNPRALTAAGLVAAALVGLAIVVGLHAAGGPTKKPAPAGKSAPSAGSSLSTQMMQEGRDRAATGTEAAPLVLPVAAVTENNYDKDSVESMARNLGVKKEFARRYTLADSVNLGVSFRRKLADDFTAAGGEGPVLEAMISFVSGSEPTLLPCYAEKAFYAGRPVIIVALSGPPRNGATRSLTRTEFWAFSPEGFLSNPETSLVWWGQSQE